MWNRTLVYLGLREEPEDTYDELPERFVPEDDPHAEHAPERPRERALARSGGGSSARTQRLDLDEDREAEVPADRSRDERRREEQARADERDAEVRRAREERELRKQREEQARTDNVRPLRTGDVHVRAVAPTPLVRAAVVDVEVFDDVEAVAARFRTGQPVVFDVEGTDATTARRVVDFVSGAAYALRGRMTKVAGRAFLLLPDGIELSAEERHRLTDLGYRVPAPPATRSVE
jgi:cell division inhibitor SepF